MRILIAYDGSESSEAALSDLPRAGLPFEAEALVYVSEVWLASSHAEFSRAGASRRHLAAGLSSFAPASRAVEEERALSREAGRRFRSVFPGWRIRVEASPGLGMPDSELMRRAVSWKADLIVVGSQSGATDAGAYKRHASHKVFGDAPCSVRISRPANGGTGAAPVQLVVGADGSNGFQTALSAIASRSWPKDSECRVVISGDSMALAAGRASDALRAIGLKTSIRERRGDIHGALVEAAREWDANCVFIGSNEHDVEMGSRGPRNFAHLLDVGAPCSVEIARTCFPAKAGALIPLARAADISSAVTAG